MALTSPNRSIPERVTVWEKDATVDPEGESLHARDNDLERDLLILLFIKWYGTILRAVHGLAIHVLHLGPVPLDDVAVRHQVLKAQAAAVAVDAQTRHMIAKRIAKGLQLGLTPREIALGTDDFPGINGLFEETWKSRSETVARTEVQKAQLVATQERFQKLARGRVIGWLAADGDYDAACAERDGRVFPANSPPDLNHPNCRLTISPILG